jgi:hypothetical protein
MKRISPTALAIFVCLLACEPGPACAAAEDILGQPPPPLDTLPGFAREEPGIAPGSFSLSRKATQELATAGPGERFSIPEIDEFIGDDAEPLEFRRIDLFAPGARVVHLKAGGVVEWQRDARQFFIAGNRSTGVGLAVDPASGEVSGFANKGSSKMQLNGGPDGRIQVQAIDEAPDGESVCSTQLDDQQAQSLAFLHDATPESLSEAPAGSGITFQAVVAVDTDNEWMAHRGNNENTAMTWITDAFLAMNVFYERDVSLHLLIGDVTLRTIPDPYSIASGASGQMDEFAAYWRYNMSSVDRDFATLMSGRGVGSNSYSGIAWINQYCVKGVSQGDRTRGSYSFNAMGVNRTPANTAIYIGHEFGHNFGSPHTHCYSPALDQCYSGEAAGCYSGPVSCPAGGKGTIMSYCHISAASGGAGCGINKSEFHPTVQSLIEGRLAANFPACISEYEEPPGPGEPPLFESSFE